MDFILADAAKLKINQSVSNSIYCGTFENFDNNQSETSSAYHQFFNRFDVNQSESSFSYHETFKSFDINQSEGSIVLVTLFIQDQHQTKTLYRNLLNQRVFF